jgi:hypothetical protein
MRPPEGKRGPGGGLEATITDEEIGATDSIALSTAQALHGHDPRYRHLTDRLWRLGPRPIGELLLEVAAGRDLITALEEDAALDPRTVAIVERATGRRCRSRGWHERGRCPQQDHV